MSAPQPKKTVMDSFFAKSKKKGVKGKESDDVSSSSGHATLGFSSAHPTSSAGWVEDDVLAATAAPLTHTVALKTRVGELTEEDMEEFDDAAAHVDIEAEEARKILWGTLKKSHKKKAAAPAAATATPAAGGGATWRDRIASRGAGSSVQGGKVDINNQYMFPDLKTALSGLPPGAMRSEPPQSMAKALESKTVWHALAVDSDSEEEEEAPAPTAATAAAPLAKAATKASPVAVAAPVVAASPLSVTEADLIYVGSSPELSRSSEISSAAEKLLLELKHSHDVGEAVTRLQEIRVTEAALREKAIESIIQFGLDAESKEERTCLNFVLRQLVLPAKFCTVSMLRRSFIAFFELYEDLATDYPRADQYFANLVEGLVPELIPAELVPQQVKAVLGIADTTPAPAIARMDSGASETAFEEAVDAEESDLFASKKKKKKAAVTFD